MADTNIAVYNNMAINNMAKSTCKSVRAKNAKIMA
jgi:hypothetical protein